MNKNQLLAILAIVLIFLLSMAFESYESKIIKRQVTVSKRLNLFDNCMERNNYDYTDALCEVCWDSTLQIFPYTKAEIKENKKHERELKKWSRRKAIK